MKYVGKSYPSLDKIIDATLVDALGYVNSSYFLFTSIGNLYVSKYAEYLFQKNSKLAVLTYETINVAVPNEL